MKVFSINGSYEITEVSSLNHGSSITYNSLRLPSRKYYEKKQYTTYHFEDETQRYDFLKNLHKCLNEWNNKYTKFIKDSDYCFRNKKVILSGEFWVI
jgi:hypothetical protein